MFYDDAIFNVEQSKFLVKLFCCIKLSKAVGLVIDYELNIFLSREVEGLAL